MSIYGVEKLLFDMGQVPTIRVRFNDDIDGLLADYSINEEEAEALRTLNIKKLYEAGINPLLLLRINLSGKIAGREAYLKLITDGPDISARPLSSGGV